MPRAIVIALFHNCEYISRVSHAVVPPSSLTPPPGEARSPRWELYRLLADPTRLRLLALAASEELAVSELAELLREGQPKVSRHATALREAGLVHARKHGTWVLLRLAAHAHADPVVADAVAAGMELCAADDTLARVPDVIAARDAATREFFARGGRPARSGPPEELAAYLRALGPLLGRSKLAIDAGTGDGALLEVLAPVFEQVIALDRSQAQLDLARQRAEHRQFRNVRFVCGEIDGPEIRKGLGRRHRGKNGEDPELGADLVFASRLLHHAPVPARAMGALVQLARPAGPHGYGGAVVVVDYESHHDEGLREQQADLWLGFDGGELEALARQAGLEEIRRGRLPRAWCGEGPDRHLGWQWLAGHRGLSD
jgi:ArsR family transcriptional regulator